MTFVAIIPARYQSSRFPGKPLALIEGKPMIQWVYENVKKTKGLSEVYVATDDKRIFDCVETFGGKPLMTSPDHTCGTDRLAECARMLNLEDTDIVLNVQGDEPLIRPELIEDLIDIFKQDDLVSMGTLKKKIDDRRELEDPNVVKVITDIKGDAIYFSRYPIPFQRDGEEGVCYKHIGIYGYRKDFLMEFSKMDKLELEQAESLEQLRVLERGLNIRVAETKWQTVGVDKPEQIALVEQMIHEQRKNER